MLPGSMRASAFAANDEAGSQIVQVRSYQYEKAGARDELLTFFLVQNA